MPLRLRTSIVRRDGRTYRYHQLTRAVRKDGKPTHEIVAHLGRLDEAEADAIRASLEALAGGSTAQRVSAARYALDEIVGRQVLRYLDVMVIHRLWTDWGLRAFFEQHLPRRDKAVAPADVVEVLVANRCLDACSKLRATEWCPRTALPEVLGFDPGQFNNTRVHRVLGQLAGIEPALTRFLVEHPLRRQEIDSVIFLDITDTWFVGQGGDLGADGKCKDGAKRRHRIQIALGVDRRGLPLRWEVFAGNIGENVQLPKWLDALAELPPFDRVPLVFDRGFSTNDNLAELVRRKRAFVTCARQPQLVDWSDRIDFASIASTPEGQRPTAKCLRAAGLTASDEDDDVFFLDQGVRTPHSTRDPLPDMRVVLFFRPSQYAFDTQRTAENRKRLFQEVDGMNAALAKAQRDRDEQRLLARLERALHERSMQYDYHPRLEAITVRNRHGRAVRSYRVTLEERDYAERKRDYNAGWRVLLANREDTRPPSQLIRLYDNKHLVEYAFRTIKSFVDLRPVRHQTTPKIKAHVTLCMLGMLLDRWLEVRLRGCGVHDSVDRVYELLEPCRLILLAPRQGGEVRLALTTADEPQRRLLRVLGMHDLAEEAPRDIVGRRRH